MLFRRLLVLDLEALCYMAWSASCGVYNLVPSLPKFGRKILILFSRLNRKSQQTSTDAVWTQSVKKLALGLPYTFTRSLHVWLRYVRRSLFSDTHMLGDLQAERWNMGYGRLLLGFQLHRLKYDSSYFDLWRSGWLSCSNFLASTLGGRLPAPILQVSGSIRRSTLKG